MSCSNVLKLMGERVGREERRGGQAFFLVVKLPWSSGCQESKQGSPVNSTHNSAHARLLPTGNTNVLLCMEYSVPRFPFFSFMTHRLAPIYSLTSRSVEDQCEVRTFFGALFCSLSFLVNPPITQHMWNGRCLGCSVYPRDSGRYFLL